MSNRVMIKGTEGKEDYLVCARKGGYILGIKPLMSMNDSQTEFGFRLRLQKAQSSEDIKNTKADSEGLLEVFSEIPWMKRSGLRFSTVLMTSIAYGPSFIDEMTADLKVKLPELLDSLADKFAKDEKFMNRKDVEAFLMEQYDKVAAECVEAWKAFKASGKQAATGASDGDDDGADIIKFPGNGDDD